MASNPPPPEPTDPDALLAATVALVSQMETLAALIAHARVQQEGLTVDPHVATLLAAVARDVLGSDELAPGAPVAQSLGMARAFLRESMQLIDDPARIGGWATTDEAVLQGVGKLSMAIAPVLVAAARSLDGLGERLSAPGSTLLDVGTGTGWLAVAVARAMPAVSVLGIDIFGPSLTLARRNVEAEGLADRVRIEERDVTTLPATREFDAIWLPLPFLPRDVVGPAITAARAALKPGGWLLPGTFAGPGNPRVDTLIDLRIVRSGGHPWTDEEIRDLLRESGFRQTTEVQRTWAAPLRLWAGRA